MHKRFAKLFVFLATILLSSHRAQSAFPLASNSSIGKEKTPLTKLTSHPDTEQDQKNEQIVNNLIKESGWFPEVKVRVDNGLIILEGDVKDKDQLDWLIKSADRLPAVVAVINNTNLIRSSITDLSPLREQIDTWINQAKKEIPRLVMAAVMILIFIFLGGFLYRLSFRLWSYRIENSFLLAVVARFSLLPVYLFMFYVVLQAMGMQSLATTIIGGTGVIGLVLGLALKGITENFFSGILLAMRSPFTKGDQIKVGDIKGVVQNLNMRGTTVMDQDGVLILIPNTTVVQSIIQNLSANPATRTSFTISIGFENSITEVQRILLNVLAKTERVLKNPAPLVLADQMEGGGINIKVYFWFELKHSSLIGSRSRVMAACNEALLQAGIIMRGEVTKVAMTDERGHTPQNKESMGLHHKKVDIENTHDQMMQGSTPDEELKKMAQEVSLPGNSQSPNLLKKEKDS